MMTENPYQSPRAETPPPKLARTGPSGDPFVRSVAVGVVSQLVLFLLTALMLDGGQLHRQCIVAMIGYWSVTAMLIVRRRKTPTNADLLFLRWGMLGLMAVIPLIGAIVYRIIGGSHLSGLQRWF